MIRKNTQQGIVAIGFLVKMLAFGIVILLAIRWIPVYFEHYSVTRAIDNLRVNSSSISREFGGDMRAAIIASLIRSFGINNVSHVNESNIQVSGVQNGYAVRVYYEVRQNLVGNIDSVITFDDSTVVPNQ